ncbi:YkvA family protein [Neobacillus dielmonensis]|uniref:YkvA family protein n=1 Tax=Neobacillus dielmonensis TaxID=1347369 RepID=UPI0005A5ED1C|nr:YkvA family protein [Neobacillus dielmonensis]
MEQENTLTKLKSYARKLKQNLFVLYLSYKDHRVPWYAKLVAICVVAYAFSPIDLIPDFIPVLGYLDDLIIVPLGISLALRLIPPYIIEENREKAEEMRENGKPKNWITAILFILIWILLALWVGKLLYRILQ